MHRGSAALKHNRWYTSNYKGKKRASKWKRESVCVTIKTSPAVSSLSHTDRIKTTENNPSTANVVGWREGVNIPWMSNGKSHFHKVITILKLNMKYVQ